ncbi:MAG TPA: tetratricopeptide repeat protein [Terracidiphilus sp.]|nr:tetratricopeptide repeat protein [Terracidiphilus sp.]
MAVAPSLAYRARKFGRRYRAGLIITSAFALVLVVATVVSVRQSIRARREAAVAQAVNNFLQNDLLAQASAENQSRANTRPDPNITVRTLLDRAAQRIDGKFPNQPEVEAALRNTIGATYDDLGMYPEAREQLEQALELDRRTMGADDPRVLTTLDRLGWVALHQGRYAEAEALESHAVEARKRVLGLENPETLTSMDHLAIDYSYRGEYAKAAELYNQVLAIQKRVLGPESPDTLASMGNLAADYSYEGKYAKAETIDALVLGIRRRVLGPESPETLISMYNLAGDYMEEGKYAQTEELYSKVLAIQKRVLGPEHPQDVEDRGGLG